MKYFMLFILIINISFAETLKDEKYNWYVVVEKSIEGKAVTEKLEITKSYIKIDENIICTADKEYIRKKFDLYPNLRAKRLTCDFLGKTFFLETACLKSEKLKVIISHEKNEFNKNSYFVTCEV